MEKQKQENNYIILNSEKHKFQNGMKILANIVDINNNNNITIAKLELDEEYLLWDIPTIIENEIIYQNGQKGAIIELFWCPAIWWYWRGMWFLKNFWIFRS